MRLNGEYALVWEYRCMPGSDVPVIETMSPILPFSELKHGSRSLASSKPEAAT
jgi:hypothetical protein